MEKQTRRVKELEERLLNERRLRERLNTELSILKVVPLVIGERFSNDLSIPRVSSTDHWGISQ